MKTKEEMPRVIYAPYIPVTTGTTINGIKVWDRRWWVNIWCKINWFFHFKERKRWKELCNKKVDAKYYLDPETITFKLKENEE